MTATRIRRRSLLRAGAAATALGALSSVWPDRAPARARQSEPVAIEYWHINTETFGGPAIEALIARFEELNPGVAVTARFQPDSYPGVLQAVQTALAAETPPDVVQIGNGYVDFVAANLPFVAPEALADEYGDDGLLAALPANVRAIGQARGETVGLPYSLSTNLTYLNADLLRQAGLDPAAPPRTWDDWREAATAIKAESGGRGIVLSDPPGVAYRIQTVIGANGGELVACAGGRPRAAFADPEAVAAIQTVADLVEDELALYAASTDEAAQAFFAGEVAAYAQTNSQYVTVRDQAPFEVAATAFPAFGEKPLRLPAGGNVLSLMSSDEAKREAAWRFVAFLLSAEGLTLWGEGTGYLPPRPELATDPAYLGGFFEADPVLAVAAAQLPDLGPWVSFPGPNGIEAEKILHDAVRAAAAGQMDAEEALGAAAEEVDALIEGETCG